MSPLSVLVLPTLAALFCNTCQAASDKRGLTRALRTAHHVGGSWAWSSNCQGGSYRQRGLPEANDAWHTRCPQAPLGALVPRMAPRGTAQGHGVPRCRSHATHTKAVGHCVGASSPCLQLVCLGTAGGTAVPRRYRHNRETQGK